jgi:hypothetical protein
MSINSDFEDLLSAFCAEGVRFLVVGGYAFTHHATPRYTKDIDLWIEADPANAARLWKALKSFGAPLAGIAAADFAREGLFVTFGREPGRVDILTSVSGVKFEDAGTRRGAMPYGRVASVPVISERDLVASKRAAGRPRDLADVEELVRRRKLGDGGGQVSEAPPVRPRRPRGRTSPARKPRSSPRRPKPRR